MALVPSFKLSSKVSSSSSSTFSKINGFSKAQMCLKKIIDIISSHGILRGSSVNPQFDGLRVNEIGSGEKAVSLFPSQRGLDVDLNLRLGLPMETEGSENPLENGGFSACSAVGGPDGKVCIIKTDCNSSVVSVDVSMIEKSSEGECDPKEVGNSSADFATIKEDKDIKAVEEETREFSEITNLQVRSSGTDDTRACEETEDGEQSETKASEEVEKEQQKGEERGEESRLFRSEENKNDGYLGLLVEAARLISGNFEDEESEPKTSSEKGGLIHEASGDSQMRAEAETETNEQVGCRSKRNRCWMFELYDGFEDISPVVRSKRGRNQVLPSRYRDSVLEPWKRLPRQRSTRVSTKRRPG
ncbi:hypothetical protein NE237_009894 [Protea cynaroides]|uniref:Uncharacterized protein n=1 Tax=Protea cynaroides TaxID=273540 RepID=A0A9Q0KYR8_9MAGN|nr:hypothetical protein NE237_009894 [Protea cynaroides]